MAVTPESGDARLQVGRIGRAHGLRGEVAVTFTSNRPERAAPGASVYAGERELVIVSARPHRGRMLVRFRGVDDRSTAEALLGSVLTACRLGAAEGSGLEEGEFWIHELVGCSVVDRTGKPLGAVVAVEANPAHDLLVLDNGSLVPMVFVVEQRSGEVVIDPPEGLFDL